ncbi:MAG TPA: DMT family transporter [Candidatus Dormibacteraeota bacterium]|nr:DMT family transporter [Candidatus Dormibacteraeota bacterium]
MTRRGLLLFAAMCVIWGIPYLFIRIAVGEITPATLVFIRTGIAAIILLPIALTRGGLRGIGGAWPWIVVFAAVEVGIPWLALSSAEQQISSALAGLLISAVPLVTLLIGIAFRNRQQIKSTNLAGLLIGLVGVALIVGFDLRASNAVALLEMAVVVIGYALGPTIFARYLTGVPSFTVNGVALALCCLAYAPFGVLQWPHAMPSIGVFAAVIVLAVICTALAFFLYFELVKEVGPVRASVITYVNPAVAALLGVAVLRESLTFGMLVGFALVLAGSALATRRPPEVLATGAPAQVRPSPKRT